MILLIKAGCPMYSVHCTQHPCVRSQTHTEPQIYEWELCGAYTVHALPCVYCAMGLNTAPK